MLTALLALVILLLLLFVVRVAANVMDELNRQRPISGGETSAAIERENKRQQALYKDGGRNG